MIRVLPWAAALLALASCSPPPPAPPSAPPDGSPGAGASPSTQPPPPAPAAPVAALGRFSGSGTLKGRKVEIAVNLNAGGAAIWKEGEAEFKGRWRKEEDQILLLLKSGEGKDLSAVLEQSGQGWAVSVYDSAQVESRDRILLRGGS